MHWANLLLLDVVCAAFAWNLRDAGVKDGTPVTVAAKCPQQTYVLGEPVLLDVTVTNITERPLQVWRVLVQDTEPQIQVYISHDEQHFQLWQLLILGFEESEWELEHLAPEDCQHYRLRVVYHPKHGSHLAFERPGEHRLKVRFPHVWIGPYSHTPAESESVVIRVKRPQGEDATVWHQLKGEEYIKFMQTGHATKQTALKTAQLLKSIPDSSYHDDLLWALAKYYYSYQWESAPDRPSEQDIALVREVLGLEKSAEFGPPTDRRLDYNYIDKRWIRDWYAKPISQRPYGLDDLLAEMTKRTGVPLRNDAGLFFPGVSVQSLKETVSLRRFIQSLADPGRTAWFRDGDGYVLKRIEVQNDQPDGPGRAEKPAETDPAP